MDRRLRLSSRGQIELDISVVCDVLQIQSQQKLKTECASALFRYRLIVQNTLTNPVKSPPDNSCG